MTFKKGQSGNPKGPKPGTLSLVWLLKEKLEEIPPGSDNSYAEQIIDRYVNKALGAKGDMLLKDIFDRTDGRPKQSPEDPGTPENPINHLHRVIWE